jgi:hypothetical protein
VKFPENIRHLLERRYRNQHRNWLRIHASTDMDNIWPLKLSLDPPTENEAQQQFDAIRSWVSSWREWKGAGEVEWCEKHWRVLGSHQMPAALILSGPEQVASWIGEDVRWRRASTRFYDMTRLWPHLSTKLCGYFGALADYDEHDYQRIKDVLAWIEKNPRSNLYPRQIPIAGLDTKWLETRTRLITDLVAGLQQDSSNHSNFFQRCGLKESPGLVRLRLLDPSLGKYIGGLLDLTCPVEELAALKLPASNVYLVENLQTGLAFNELSGAIVVTGLGFGVTLVSQIPWISSAQCIYWGDIDTYGFAILSLARKCLPQMRSVLMDEATLISHRTLWGQEVDQYPASELPLLTDSENSVYRALKQQQWGRNVRLEQERIAWDYAWNAIRHTTN